jgi:hypothetical protein
VKVYREGDDFLYAHWKRDGNCVEVRKNALGIVNILTRTPTDITEQVKFVPTLQNFWFKTPNNSAVMGELWYPYHPASYVKTAIKNRDPRLRFEAFAVGGLPAETRLEDVRAWCVKFGLPFIPWETFSEDLMTKPLPPDVEGYVFKNGNLLDWRKWKLEHTIDLICTGVTEGKTGQTLGFIGSLLCSTIEGHEVAKVSGMDWVDRDRFTDNPPIGQVVEVTYQYVGSKGRLRHPRFKRLRDDKPASDCTLSQDPALEKAWQQ